MASFNHSYSTEENLSAFRLMIPANVENMILDVVHLQALLNSWN